MTKLFFDETFAGFARNLTDWGEPSFRTRQIWAGVYRNLIFDPNAISNLPKGLREKIAVEYSFEPLSTVRRVVSSSGLTEKYLFALSDKAKIEAVLMRYRNRNTICISTQSGCAMNCAFCATGQMGLTRNLTAGEIAGQVLYFAGRLKREEKQLTNVVVMGMGEPFHNYENVMRAMDLINDPDGFRFGERRVTISTVGIIPMIEKFTKARRQINLAISLHAPTNFLRDQIIPANKKYQVHDLVEAARRYADFTKRRVSFEYAMIDGFNDSIEQAAQLAKLLRGTLCHVNLISLNPTRKYARSGSGRATINDFQAALEKAGIPCTIRLSRGVDIGAGCGQLLAEYKEK